MPLSHEEMMAAKIAMLEGMVCDLLAGAFSAEPNPQAAADHYFDKRWPISPAPTSAPLTLVRDAILIEFRDRVAQRLPHL